MNKISVVILNWNGCEMLRSFLPSVLRYSEAEGVEVCVADNGSTDQSVEMLRREFPSVRRILLDGNHGFADGYNLALRQVEAEYVVLLNSDVEVTGQWLQPMAAYLDAHPEVAACQPKIRSWRQKEWFEYAGAAGGFIDRYGYPFCRGRVMGVVEADRGQYDTVLPIFWATGAAMFIRLADYREAGGLDGRFFAHMEEIDLCWRLRARGRGIVCIPQSVVYHVGGATLKKENPHKTFLNFRNNLVMLYKNLPDRELAGVMRVRCWLDYIAAATFALKGQLPNAKAVVRARREFKLLRDSFRDARAENLRKTSSHFIPERIKSSILVQFYVKRRKFFSQLSDLKDDVMEKLIRRIGLVAHDAMKKDLIEWVLWNSELLMGHKFYCTGTTGTLIQEALKEKHPDVEWDFTILKSGPLGGDQQMGSRIVDGEIDYLFFFTDPMTLQPHDTDVKALTRLASVENIVFCCNRSTADHIISSPLFLDPDYERTHPDYSGYTKRFENKPVVTEAVESVKKRKRKK